MSIRATFIGVDRFADNTIRDLSGCRHDAQALHALFVDSLTDINAKLLLDEQATQVQVREALAETFDAASESDIVILSFSGHGTRDHRLVVHDTVKQEVVCTAIDMGELAACFKRCKAKAILCILDCCFSGGAPARVLEDTPVPRSPGTPLTELAGEGRILIAASNIDQPALEFGGHGLLTRALIEALVGDGSPLSLVTVLDEVMARVRTDAARLGHEQTPVMFGHIEGGLVLPSLQKGKQYFATFPEEERHHVSGSIGELATFGIPNGILDVWQTQFPKGLNKLQIVAVNEKGILNGKSLLVVAPTSSGKTFIGELAAARAVADRQRVVFLFPYKALTNEKCDQFQNTYGKQLGLRIIRCTSDSHDQTSQFINGKYDIAVLTYEMFLGLVVSSPAALNVVGLVVLDEAQFVTDPKRGIVVELLLTYILSLRHRGITPQLIVLSAVIGGLNGFDQWLGAEQLVTNERPVPLIEGVLDRNGTYRFRDSDGAVKVEQLVRPGEISQRGREPGAQDVIVPLVRKLITNRDDERIIIFRNSRGPAEGCAAYLAKELGLPSALDVISALPTTDPSSTSRKLRECLVGGTAFHNANLVPAERVCIERAFRDPRGPIRVLGATTTVAAGINTPASTVVLAEHEFFGEDGRAFTVAEYKNMAGRAGRLGFNESGRAIILADDDISPDALFDKYVLASPEPFTSSFTQDNVETWILRLLSQTRAIPRTEVSTLLGNTYGGYLAGRANPKWHEQTESELAALLSQMIDLGLVDEECGLVKLTLLGQICGRSSLSFSSALRLVRILRLKGGPLTSEQLLVLIQALPECDAIPTPLLKRGHIEERWPQEVARTYGHDATTALQSNASDMNEYRARCKRAMVLASWISGMPMDEIETRTNAGNNTFWGKISSGHVRQFAENARFHLRSAFDIASILLVDNAPHAEEVESLLLRLEFGVVANSAAFAGELPVALRRGELFDLAARGVVNVEQLLLMDEKDLAAIVGADVAKQLLTHRQYENKTPPPALA